MMQELGAENEVIAACALCPNEDCGSLAISYRMPAARTSDLWDFECSRCGTEFLVSEGELAFQSMALTMLLGKLPHITHA